MVGEQEEDQVEQQVKVAKEESNDVLADCDANECQDQAKSNKYDVPDSETVRVLIFVEVVKYHLSIFL